jgi:hypothetical protein
MAVATLITLGDTGTEVPLPPARRSPLGFDGGPALGAGGGVGAKTWQALDRTPRTVAAIPVDIGGAADKTLYLTVGGRSAPRRRVSVGGFALKAVPAATSL